VCRPDRSGSAGTATKNQLNTSSGGLNAPPPGRGNLLPKKLAGPALRIRPWHIRLLAGDVATPGPRLKRDGAANRFRTIQLGARVVWWVAPVVVVRLTPPAG